MGCTSCVSSDRALFNGLLQQSMNVDGIRRQVPQAPAFRVAASGCGDIPPYA
jgi:hypothetical protein